MPYSSEKTAELWSMLNNHTSHSMAWREEEVEKMKALIHDNADFTIKAEPLGNTILHLAILGKSPDLALFVLQQDAQKSLLNIQDAIREARNTPLMLAIKSGYYDLAISLLKAGADPNIVSGYDDMGPLHYAMGLLGVEYNQSTTELYQADNRNHEKLINLIHELLKHHADVNAKNIFGSTPFDILDQRFDKKKDDDIFELKSSFPHFFEIADHVWQDYIENYKNKLRPLDAELEDAYDDENKKKAAQAKIDDVLKPASEEVRAVYRLNKDYQMYNADCVFFDDTGDQKSLGEIQKAHPKFAEFRELEFHPKRYSCQALLALSKEKKEFAHLNSIEAIHADSAKPDGIIKKFVAKDYSHSYEVNDYHSINAGVTWHRQNFQEQNLFDNRNKFLSSPAGQNLVRQLHELARKPMP